jgi:hypothetical protein
MQLEISRLTRKSILQINYDATSCYDRIIPNLAALVSRKFGVPQPVTQTNAITLQRAQYRLKTELGLSEQTYSHQANDRPIYGTGQGSGNSPMIWCFLSSVLFDAYEENARGATYEFPDRSGHIQIRMIGYVDDSNGQTNMFTHDTQPSSKEMIAAAQDDAQEWHRCTEGVWRCARIVQMHIPIALMDLQQRRITVCARNSGKSRNSNPHRGGSNSTNSRSIRTHGTQDSRTL